MADADAKVQLLRACNAVSARGRVAELAGGRGDLGQRRDPGPESGNNRIQALDLGGNPVRHFNKLSGGNFPTQPDAGRHRLDPGLKYLTRRSNTPAGCTCCPTTRACPSTGSTCTTLTRATTSRIATTLGVNAARLTVDLWRNVYTLNYEALSLPGGGPPHPG